MSSSFYDKTPKTNVELVISALNDPNYTWRTSQGVSQATSLPLSEVQKIISELQQDGRVMKSSIPDIRGRPLYKANPTRILIKQLSETKPDDIQQKIGVLADFLTPHHEFALRQTKLSFVATLIAAAVGFVFLLCAIAFLLIEHSQSTATFSVISGAIAGLISGLFLSLHGQTTKQLDHYSRQLDQLNRFLLANSICESLEGESRQKARSDLVSKIVTVGVEQPHEK